MPTRETTNAIIKINKWIKVEPDFVWSSFSPLILCEFTTHNGIHKLWLIYKLSLITFLSVLNSEHFWICYWVLDQKSYDVADWLNAGNNTQGIWIYVLWFLTQSRILAEVSGFSTKVYL